MKSPSRAKLKSYLKNYPFPHIGLLLFIKNIRGGPLNLNGRPL